MIHDVPTRCVVLVIDDSPESLQFLTDALYGSGMTVLVSTSGADALALLDQIKPDIVLMDAVMPELDGFETCRRMKQDRRFDGVPVVFMTGLSDTQHVVEGFTAGGVDYITKPIIADELIARILVHRRNAEITRSARLALDAAGALFAVNREGQLKWTTAQASTLLNRSELPELTKSKFPYTVTCWMITSIKQGSETNPKMMDITPILRVGFVAAIGPDEFLFSISEKLSRDEKLLFKERFQLTPRECDVLVWISKGKSNRDIAEILGLSPRTVNKHLEQIYAKLGLENRTAAAAIAIEHLMNY